MKNYISGGIEYDWKTGRPVEGSTVYDQSTQVKTLKPEIQGSIDAANANALNNLSTKGQASAKSQRRGGILRYPLEALTGSTDYLQINIVEYKRTPNQFTRPTGFGANTLTSAAGGTTSGSLARRSVINDGSILLQVPSNVQDTNNVQYDTSSLNGLAAVGVKAAENVMGIRFGTNVSPFEQLANAAGEAKTGITKGFGTNATTGGYVAFSGTNQITGASSGATGTTAGTTETVTLANANTVTLTSGYANPELAFPRGNIIYLENRKPIQRASDQTEDIKVIIEF